MARILVEAYGLIQKSTHLNGGLESNNVLSADDIPIPALGE